MKNILIIITIALITSSLQAQVGIERVSDSELVRGDAIMDFESPATKGILLPRVTSTPEVPTAGGAMVFNLDTQRVEHYNANENTWKPMTEPSEVTVEGHNSNDSMTDLGSGALITAGTVTNTNIPSGVLVLESDNKALVLPQVENATLLPSPKAGTICYDMATKSIAVYNGTHWSFWN